MERTNEETQVKPRVFVGTMHYQEGDFQSCLRVVQEQKGISLTHFLVSGLEESQAHAELWSAWHRVRDCHDLFVKVDADTVLQHDQVLLEFWRLVSSNDRITGVQAPLYDFFTDDLINGLNAFRPCVSFRAPSDTLFVDRVDVGHDIIVPSEKVPESLRPAGLHCHQATDRQAFHYGLHRALKGQAHVIKKVRNVWKRTGDRTRAMALLGAAAAWSFSDMRGFSYPDERFKLAMAMATERFDELTAHLRGMA